MIISRYLVREILQSLVAVTIILLFIFSCNIFVRYLSLVADGKYPAWILTDILLFQLPILLGLLLPLGLYLGILLGFGRMYADNEMTVLSACGFSQKQLLRVTLFFSVLIMIVVGILSLWIQPLMTARSREVLSDAAAGSLLQTVSPGRFQPMNNGERVFYVETVSHNKKELGNVFVAQRMRPDQSIGDTRSQKPGAASSAKGLDPWGIVYASGAHEYRNPEGNRYIVMTDGRLYKGYPGQGNFEIAQYDQYGIRTNATPDTSWINSIDALPTSKLIFLLKRSSAYMAEFQWRISAPISVLLLALVALPLSRLKPRQGKFSRMLPALLLYIVYANFLFVGRWWFSDGKTPFWLGLWWVHVMFILLSLFVIKCLPIFSYLPRLKRKHI